MKPQAYVGITGFKEDAEVAKVATQFMQTGFLGPGHRPQLPNDYQPMFGFLCSSKRLEDVFSEGRQSPPVADLGCLTRYTPKGSLSMIHYFTESQNSLAEEVKQVFSIDGMYEHNFCRALQINMAWPLLSQL